MSRRSSVVALVAVGLLLLGLPRTSQAQCTNIVVPGPAVNLARIPCYVVSVTPDGATTPTRATNGSGFTAAFTVKNAGFNSDTYTFTCQGSSGVTCSSFTPTSKTLASNGTVTVTVTYATGSTFGTGRLNLTAMSVNSDDAGYYNVPIVRYGVTVSPKGVADTSRTTNTSGYSRHFTVTNTGSGQNTYTLTCSGSSSPVVTCGTVSPSSLTLGTGAVDSASVSYGVGAAGTGTLTLSAAGTSATDNGSYSIPIVAAAVQVTPPAGTAGPWLTGSTGHTATFTVQNTGTARNTYTLTCGGVDVTCTNVNPASTTLNAGATAQPIITYNAGASGATGTVTLTATGGATATGTDSVVIVSPSQQAPVLAAGDASPGATVERSLCLTVAMGQAAGAECGDLRVVHALSTTKTMNKARTPTLLYNSQFAHPFPLVALNVMVPATAIVPDSVRAVVKINGVARDSAAWVGSQWSAGQTRRIVLGWDGLGDTTGVYSYTVEVRNKYLNPANQLLTTFTGTLAIVNRSTSPFGAGWWLAGVEHLNVSNMVWVAGDGSVRQYQPAGTNVWAAARVDHPDTLKKDAVSGNYTRYDRDSLRVVFDPTGQHITTINRQGHTTSFAWTSGRLTTITLPPSGSGKTYQFAYDANNKLQTVSSPSGTGTRTTTVTVTSGQVLSIRDPDNTTVQFAYSPSAANAMTSRTDRRGTVTSYSYDGGERLSQSSINMGASQPAIVTGLTALETRGFQGSSSVDTALAYAKLDGPRTDVADTTLVWVDLLGAPRRIVDALGNITRIVRADPHWPALATSVNDATGFQTLATYDTLRGNLVTSIHVNGLGDGRNDTTTYTWHPKWDELVRIRQPEGETDTLSYDAVGNRLWQRDARGAVSEVDFGYNAANQLTSITLPGTAAQQIRYDAIGNLDTVKTPKGYLTTYQNDGAGRVTSIATQIDTMTTAGQLQQFYYDAADRDTLNVTTGAGAPAVTVTVRKYFTNGLTDSLSRSFNPDPVPAIGTITTRWQYDAAGRKIVEVAPGPDQTKRDSTGYDAAGNVTARYTRRVFANHLAGPITLSYDALNRLMQRAMPVDSYPARPSGIANGDLAALDTALAKYLVPADTEAFTYDPVSRVLTANNSNAQVARSYYANGLLQTETLRVADAARSNFTQHIYVTTSTYDRNGRRIALTVPTQFRPTPQQTQILFGYSAPAFGPLTSATDLQGSQYGFQYNARGELQTVLFPSSHSQTYAYDADGRLAADTVRNNATIDSLHLPAFVRASKFSYDGMGRLLQRIDPLGSHDTLNLGYNGLGQLLSVTLTQNGVTYPNTPWTYNDNETYTYDGLGNRLTTLTNAILVASIFRADTTLHPVHSQHFSKYELATGRLVSDSDLTVGRTSYTYDADGAEVYTVRTSGAGRGVPEERASFYGVDGRLRRVDVRFASTTAQGSVPWKEVGEDHRYDALGRRVWTLAIKTCSYPSYSGVEQAECKTSLMRRTVWDGTQELGEIQMPLGQVENDGAFTAIDSIVGQDGSVGDPNPWFGEAVYVNALAVDQPLAITRLNFVQDKDPNPFNPAYHGAITKAPMTVVPFWTAQGDASVGVFTDGYPQECSPPNSRLQCANPTWLLYWSAYDRQRVFWDTWWGTLLQGKADKSGLQYRRNRFYDPGTGRFTQEDPIGLAGGMNLYGFAGGDPVNYSDPFGLDPCMNDQRGNCTQAQEGQLGQHNETIIRGVDPRLQPRVRAMTAAAGAAGRSLYLIEGFRSNEKQDADFAKGRTAPGSIVTYARGGQSPHNYGLAVDVGPATPGGKNVNWQGDFKPIGELGEAAGLEWGGRWPQPKTDRPHVQMPDWRTLIP